MRALSGTPKVERVAREASFWPTSEGPCPRLGRGGPCPPLGPPVGPCCRDSGRFAASASGSRLPKDTLSQRLVCSTGVQRLPFRTIFKREARCRGRTAPRGRRAVRCNGNASLSGNGSSGHAHQRKHMCVGVAHVCTAESRYRQPDIIADAELRRHRVFLAANQFNPGLNPDAQRFCTSWKPGP